MSDLASTVVISLGSFALGIGVMFVIWATRRAEDAKADAAPDMPVDTDETDEEPWGDLFDDEQ